MAKSTVNLQDSFLNQVRKDGSRVKVILLDGTKLDGVVRGFDSFTIVMTTGDSQHLVYKHAIGQIIGERATQQNRRGNSERRSSSKANRVGGEPRKTEAFNTLNVSSVTIPEDSES